MIRCTDDFIQTFIIKEEGSDLYTTQLQPAYLTYCAIYEVEPIPFYNLWQKIELTFDIKPFRHLLDPTMTPYYRGLKLNVPEQDISEFKEAYYPEE